MDNWNSLDKVFDVAVPVIEWVVAAWLIVAVVAALSLTCILVFPVWIVAGIDKGVQMLMRWLWNGR